jgi:hypothetical protein
VARQPGALGPHPAFQCGNQRLDPLLSDGMPLLGRGAVDLALDGEDLVDAANRLDRQWRLPQIGQHKELAPAVRPARRFGDPAGSSLGVVEIIEAGIGVGLQGADPAGEMPARMLAAAVTRVEEHGGRRIAAAERSVIPHVGPQPSGHGLVFGQHRHGRIVTVDPVGGQDMTADQLDERCQRGAASPHPIGQGRHIQLNAFAGIDVTLPIERLMLAEFGIEDHRQ